ncbi:MAG: hypothetical protein P4L81_03820, partial [Candidatus Pacebacteria bacterium]|nr:hypothetical protein [Candidatus Paceibacterota bacterium]
MDAGIEIEDNETKTLDSQWSIMKNSGADIFNRVDWVIIDEKSFIKEGFWKCLLQVLHRSPKCRFVLCGDWHQLPPVCDRKEFDYEHSRVLWELSAGRMMEFTHCRRADSKLFRLCKGASRDIDAVDLKQFPSAEHERSLAYLNSVRKAVNHRWMLQKTKDKSAVKYIDVPAIA